MEVYAVDPQLAAYELRDLAVASPCQRKEAVPEEAVVDHQKMSVAAHCFCDGRLGCIHRGAQVGHLLRTIHL